MKKVFISYSWEHDTDSAKRIYKDLSHFDLDIWMDKKNLRGGEAYRPAIIKAIRESDYFLALLSADAVKKRRAFIHYEMNVALEVLKEFAPSEVYLVPARINKCTSRFEDVNRLNFVNMYPDWKDGIEKIITAIGAKPIERKKKAVKKRKPAYRYKVALFDLDIGIPKKQLLIKKLNSIQSYFHFTIPVLPPLRNKTQRIEGNLQFNVSKVSASYIKKNKHIETDFIACLTHLPLAFEEAGYIWYNYFAGPSDHDSRFFFISTDQLPEYSKEAKRKFEEALVYLIAGQLIRYFSDAGYHEPVRSCVMDFCRNRYDMVLGLKKRKLCADCAKLLPKGPLKTAINALLRLKYH